MRPRFMQYVPLPCATPMVILRSDDMITWNAVLSYPSDRGKEREEEDDRSIRWIISSQANVVIKPPRIAASFASRSTGKCGKMQGKSRGGVQVMVDYTRLDWSFCSTYAVFRHLHLSYHYSCKLTDMIYFRNRDHRKIVGPKDNAYPFPP